MNACTPGISSRLTRRSLRILLLVVLVPALYSCGSDSDEPQPVVDTTPPGPITDLVASAVSDSSLLLRWTAPGDDGEDGQVLSYDIRVSTAVVTMANFDSAGHVPSDDPPASPGFPDSVLVDSLLPNTAYHFAIRTSDEAQNLSLLSNTATASTLARADIVPPRIISDLVATPLGPTSIELTWTAPGDDGDVGTASAYDLHAAVSPFSTIMFPTHGKISTGAPSIAGTQERLVVEQLHADFPYYFIIRTADEALNWSGGSAIVGTRTIDVVPPARVTSLTVKSKTLTSITVEWDATGDNSSNGLAHHYDVRYSSQPLTEENWDAATPVEDEPTPRQSGSKEQVTIANLDTEGLTYAALKVVDESGNASELSNVASAALARIINVHADGSGDAPTIQAALDMALDGDVILVGPGTYFENLNFRGREVQLKSANGRDQTTIDGRNAPESVIAIDHEEGPLTLVEGFTIRNGHCAGSPAPDRRNGGGIRVVSARPTIRDCRVVGNTGRFGGGISINGPSSYRVLVEHCEIDSNSSFYNGGGLDLTGSVHLRDNRVERNAAVYDAGGLFLYYALAPSIVERNVFIENRAGDHGGAIAGGGSGAAVEIRNNVFIRNVALSNDLPDPPGDGAAGGAIAIAEDVRITNNTFVDNRGESALPDSSGGAIGWWGADSGDNVYIGWNIIVGSAGTGVAFQSGLGVPPRPRPQVILSLDPNLFWQNAPFNVAGFPVDQRQLWNQNIIEADPLFCDPGADDYGVLPNSPALIGGHVFGAFQTSGCGNR